MNWSGYAQPTFAKKGMALLTLMQILMSLSQTGHLLTYLEFACSFTWLLIV